MIGPGTFWSSLRREMDKERASLVEELALGHIATGEYREYVARIATLDWVRGRAAKILGDEDRPVKQPEEQENFA